MENQSQKNRTLWHRLLGDLLKLLLSPVGITVHIEFSLMSESPRLDILLLKRELKHWTDEQLRRIPDGLRNSLARHLILEFKYTESLTLQIFLKACGYLAMYQETQKIEDSEVELFVISAKTPQQAFRTLLQYSEAEAPGVYRSTIPLLQRIHLICLNELQVVPHNAFIKCFASRTNEKRKAFSLIQREFFDNLSTKLYWFIRGLSQLWFKKGEVPMKEAFTSQDVLEMGQIWGDNLFAMVSPEEVLSHYKLEEVLSHYKPSELLSHIQPEEVFSHYKPEELLSSLSVEEIQAYLLKVSQTS